jgi:hypothetical protein
MESLNSVMTLTHLILPCNRIKATSTTTKLWKLGFHSVCHVDHIQGCKGGTWRSSQNWLGGIEFPQEGFR